MPADFYAILGVSRGADTDAIKKAFRSLALKYHPDRNPGNANDQRFKDANRAHEVLSDRTKRALYDEFGEESLSIGFDAARARMNRPAGPWTQRARGGGGGQTRGPNPGWPPSWSPVAEAAQHIAAQFLDQDYSDILKELLSEQYAAAPRQGRDLEVPVTIDFASAVKGTTLQVLRHGAPVDVRIPAGVEEGTQLRIVGLGHAGFAGRPSGDVIFVLHVTPHRHFTRQGDDLHLLVPLTIGEAYSGATIGIPTPSGEVRIKLAPRTQSGHTTRLAGRGVARQGKPPGALYLKFIVYVATNDSPEVAKAVDVLASRAADPRGALRW